MRSAAERGSELSDLIEPVVAELSASHKAREVALPACRDVIRAASRSIRNVHLGDPEAAARFADEAEAALRKAQDAVVDQPGVAQSGPLHDAEKEYAEARLTAVLVSDEPLPTHEDLAVSPQAWLRGLGEATSELRRHLLDRLRRGELETAEALLDVMDEMYDALFAVDFPDGVTHGLRRTVDQLRGVLERTRGDVTTTLLQERLRHSIEQRSDG